MGFGGGSQQQSSATDTASWATNFMNAVSQNASASNSSSSSFIDPTQAGFLQNLWGQGAAATNPAAATKTATGLVGQTMPSLTTALKSATALTNPATQIAAQAKSLKAGLGNLWTDELLPGIKSNAISAGGFGGGRQGVAEGVAAGQLADTYAEALGDITANANSQALNAGSQVGSLGSAIYNLGMSPGSAGLSQLAQFASLLGSPTVLQQALSKSASSGSSKSTGGGEQRSVGTSRSGSSGWDFNFGWPSQ